MSDTTNNVPIVNYSAASAMVGAVVENAVANGWKMAVVVVDPWGEIVASARMDGVAPPIHEMALDKAYTATLGKTTKGFYERMSSSPDLTLGLQNRPRLCVWEGGLPLYKDGQLAGAIGVSGAEGKDDAACGEQALTSLGFSSAP